jgi:hypothetical protein
MADAFVFLHIGSNPKPSAVVCVFSKHQNKAGSEPQPFDIGWL